MKEVQVAYARELIDRIKQIEYEDRHGIADGDEEQYQKECQLSHLRGLCQRLIVNHTQMSPTKCARWVGFVQGVLCARHCSTVEREKRAYKACKKRVLEELNGQEPNRG